MLLIELHSIDKDKLHVGGEIGCSEVFLSFQAFLDDVEKDRFENSSENVLTKIFSIHWGRLISL